MLNYQRVHERTDFGKTKTKKSTINSTGYRKRTGGTKKKTSLGPTKLGTVETVGPTFVTYVSVIPHISSLYIFVIIKIHLYIKFIYQNISHMTIKKGKPNK